MTGPNPSPSAQLHLARWLEFAERHLSKYVSTLEQSLATGEVESVHDVRVASRRLQAVLLTLDGVVPQRRSSSLRAFLKKTRRAFRKVRDFDVFGERIAEWNSHGELLGGEDAERLSRFIEERRAAALGKARRRCAKQRASDRISRIRRVLESARMAPAEQLHERLQETSTAQVASLCNRQVPEMQKGELHAWRVQVKRARYHTELLYRLEGREDDTFLVQLTEMQERLGRWNDRRVAARTCIRIAGVDDVLEDSTEWAEALLRCSVILLERLEQDREEIARTWQDLVIAARGVLFTSCVRGAPAAPPRQRPAAASQHKIES